jgi:hypothetical protein
MFAEQKKMLYSDNGFKAKVAYQIRSGISDSLAICIELNNNGNRHIVFNEWSQELYVYKTDSTYSFSYDGTPFMLNVGYDHNDRRVTVLHRGENIEFNTVVPISGQYKLSVFIPYGYFRESSSGDRVQLLTNEELHNLDLYQKYISLETNF